MWTAGWNTPGCLPETAPETFETFAEARTYLIGIVDTFWDQDACVPDLDEDAHWLNLHTMLGLASEVNGGFTGDTEDHALSFWIVGAEAQSAPRTDTLSYWACVDCFEAVFSADAIPGLEWPELLQRGPHITYVDSLPDEQHQCGEYPGGIACNCETDEFSRWPCETCGSDLAGARRIITRCYRQPDLTNVEAVDGWLRSA